MVYCQRCEPGTWSDLQGAEDEAMCLPCPLGTWSSQEGSPTVRSCQNCPAGTWGASEGLGSLQECTRCPAGTWSTASGATSEAVCSPCPGGTWSGFRGATSNSHCIECPRGTWSDEEGASAQSSCQPCAEGTWSNVTGAAVAESCAACPAGTYQPARGQASEKVCINCPPGTFSVGGAGYCSACPPGSWTSGFGATSCETCPEGTWTAEPGASRASDCHRCGAKTCGLSDLRIQAYVSGVEWADATPTQLETFETVLTKEFAFICGVATDAVMDLYGQNASITWDAEQRTVSAFIVARPLCGATELKLRLMSRPFLLMLIDAVGGEPFEGLRISGISAKLEAFSALPPTTARTTAAPATTTAAATSSSAAPELNTTTTAELLETTAAAAEGANASAAGEADEGDGAGADAAGDAAGSTAKPSGQGTAKDIKPEEAMTTSPPAVRDEKTSGGKRRGPPSWLWAVVGGVVVGCALMLWNAAPNIFRRSKPDAEPGAAAAAAGDEEHGAVAHEGGAGVAPLEGQDPEADELGLPTLLSGTRARSAPNFLRTGDTTDGEWFDGEAPKPDAPRASYDCTKGCTVWC